MYFKNAKLISFSELVIFHLIVVLHFISVLSCNENKNDVGLNILIETKHFTDYFMTHVLYVHHRYI